MPIAVGSHVIFLNFLANVQFLADSDPSLFLHIQWYYPSLSRPSILELLYLTSDHWIPPRIKKNSYPESQIFILLYVLF